MMWTNLFVFCSLELITIKDLLNKLQNNNSNPRKRFFDEEINEAIKAYRRILKKYT